MLNIIYGLENTNRDELAYNLIRTKIEADQVCYILVPEQFSMYTEKFIINKFGISAQTRAKVITFSRLSNLILQKMGPLRLKYIDGAGKHIIASRTIREMRGELSILEQSLKRQGFSKDIVGIVSEMKRYGVSAQELAEFNDEEYPKLTQKMQDIGKLLSCYNTLLEKQSADADDNLELICGRIKECDFLKGNLFIMNFRSFTPVEYKVIGELMQKMDVYPVMSCDDIYKSSDLFSPISATCRELEEMAKELNITVFEPIRAEVVEDNELTYLTKNYFASRPKESHSEPQKIEIFQSSNAYREVEEAGDLILKLCRTENRKFSDFLILARDTENYNRIMPSVFGAKGIDVFLDTRRSILTKPFAKFLCSTLEILAYGYSYDRVMSIARCGLSDVPQEEIDVFENYLLQVNPSHAMWNEDKWEFAPKGYDMELINSVRHRLLDYISEINNSFDGRKTAKDICSVILKTIESQNLAERMEVICDEFTKNGMPYLSDEYRQVWNSIISVIAQISALMDEENITFEGFFDLLKNALSGISVGLTPQTQGSVIFSSIDKFRSNKPPIVIVLGMTEGVFPKAHTAEGLLSDSERATLEKKGIRLAKGADFKRAEEQIYIYSVFSAPKEKLYLFTPLADTDGKILEPSPILKKIQTRIYPKIKITNPDTADDFLAMAEGRESAFNILCGHLAKSEGKKDLLSEGAKILYEYFASDDQYKKRLDRITNSMINTKGERLSKEAVKEIYGETLYLSASKLEKYNACAFSYFMNYGLLAREREKSGIEPTDMGTIQHDSLEKYFDKVKNDNIDFKDISIDDCYKDVYEIVREEGIKANELLYESSAHYKYHISRMQGIAARTAWEVVKFYKSSKFRPLGFEIGIGMDGEIPSIAIIDNGKKIGEINGRIDRLDGAVIGGKNYISVIDYKSSSKKLEERLVDAGVTIQPLLYADAVCRRMNASPAAMIYNQMTDPIIDSSKLKTVTFEEIEKNKNSQIAFNGWINSDEVVLASYSEGGENGEKYIPSKKFTEAELKEKIDMANQKIKEAALGICNGNIDARPYADKGFNACDWCIYGSVCQK